MERIAVFVDDAEHALHLMAPLQGPAAPPMAWVVVACPPKLTHRIGKYVSHRSRELWRERWAAQLRERLAPTLRAAPAGHAHEWHVATQRLIDVVARLRLRHGSGLLVLDARRPKLGAAQAPLTPGQPDAAPPRWAAPLAVSSSLSLMLALSD